MIKTIVRSTAKKLKMVYNRRGREEKFRTFLKDNQSDGEQNNCQEEKSNIRNVLNCEVELNNHNMDRSTWTLTSVYLDMSNSTSA